MGPKNSPHTAYKGRRRLHHVASLLAISSACGCLCSTSYTSHRAHRHQRSRAPTMSQSHSHGPGQPSHTHGPTPPPQQQQQAVMRPPDPVMQALIEASFVPVDVGIAQDNFSLLCTTHSKEKCADCDVDYAFLNRISKTLLMNPAARCPPPPNAVNPKLSQAVEAVKNEGNVRTISLN